MVGGLSLVRRLVPVEALDLPGVFNSNLNSRSYPRSCELRTGCGGPRLLPEHSTIPGRQVLYPPLYSSKKQRLTGSEVLVSQLDRVTKTEIHLLQLLPRACFPWRLCGMEGRKGAVEVSGVE